MRTLTPYLTRIVRLIFTFLIVTFLATLILNLVPGDPASYIAGESASPQVIAALNKQYHFNDPVLTRYLDWLNGFIHGDLGTSVFTKQPVSQAIGERLPVTLELAILGTLLSLCIAIPLAIATARRPGSRLDRWVAATSSAGVSVPSFVVAVLLVYVFAYKIELFPPLGWVPLTDNVVENLRRVVLPLIAISVVETIILVRVLRADLLNTLQQDYIALARAKGLSTRAIMWKHALRPSSLSLLTLSGLILARTIGGTVIVESIFVLPGLGSLALQSISQKDLIMTQGVVAFVAVAFLIINFIVDMLYGVLDPRTRIRT